MAAVIGVEVEGGADPVGDEGVAPLGPELGLRADQAGAADDEAPIVCSQLRSSLVREPLFANPNPPSDSVGGSRLSLRAAHLREAEEWLASGVSASGVIRRRVDSVDHGGCWRPDWTCPRETANRRSRLSTGRSLTFRKTRPALPIRLRASDQGRVSANSRSGWS